MTPQSRPTCEAPVRDQTGKVCKCGVVGFMGTNRCWVHSELPKDAKRPQEPVAGIDLKEAA